MKLRDLIASFKHNCYINIALFDALTFVCVAPWDSPVLDKYLDREVGWIGVLDKPEKGSMVANLEVVLDIKED